MLKFLIRGESVLEERLAQIGKMVGITIVNGFLLRSASA